MRLHEFTTHDEVPHYSCAVTPGRHCPLFGAAAVLRNIAGVTLLYIGTQDCVYYAQKDALTRQLTHLGEKQLGFRTLAAQLSDADLIFGIRPQLEALLEQEALRSDVRSIFLVTSCSVEVLSEDLQGVITAVSRRTGKYIALVPTENFKTFSYIDGIEAAMKALTGRMKPHPVRRDCFAILGARQRGAEQCEPVRFLLAHGYSLHSVLPYEIDADHVDSLPEAAFTVVVDGSGLGVAQRLRDEFGTPFVRFDQRLDLESIAFAWRQLGHLTGENVEPWLLERIADVEQLTAQVREKVTGKTVFYGQKVLYPFETCLFLTKLGMIPTCIFLGSVLDKSDAPRLALEKQVDPVLWLNADQAAVTAMLNRQPPDYIVGITGSMIRGYLGTAVRFPTSPLEVGFTFYDHCLRLLLEAEKMEVTHESI